jgi:hypothetical protein
MRRKMLAVMLMLVGVLPACAQVAPDRCTFEAPRNLDLSAAGVDTLEVRARAGGLEIRGEPGLDQVQVRGMACASREADLEDIRLVQRREGDRLVVAVEIPDTSGLFNGQRRLDLKLRVPSRLTLDVDDSSGAASVENVAALRIDDSSGELRVSGIPGAVRIEDSSGAIDVRDVGSLHIPSDSSGEIRVADVRGDATIDSDSSGAIELRGIGGNARIGRDSSGSIEVEDVGGDFTVGSDGSGGIEHRGVRGKVSIPND